LADAGARAGLVVLDDETSLPVPARWAGQLLVLGARLARRRRRDGWQLVVGISVPTRLYGALLISSGWILAQPGVRQSDVLAEARSIAPGTPVRLATAQWLVAERFYGVDSTRGKPRIHVGGSSWMIDAIDHIAADPALHEDRFGRTEVTKAGSLVKATGHGTTWAADQCACRPTVAVVGIRTRLEPELALQAGWAGRDGHLDRLADILRPDEGKSAFCASAILPGGMQYLPEAPTEAQLVVLDGATAIRWLPEVRTPVVVGLIDRSSADESAAIALLQRRSMGQPVAVGALGWDPLPGIETLAFEVRA